MTIDWCKYLYTLNLLQLASVCMLPTSSCMYYCDNHDDDYADIPTYNYANQHILPQNGEVPVG